MAESSSPSKEPLVPLTKRKRPSWWQRNISDPYERFNLVEALFVRKVPASPPRSIHINEPLPAEYLDKKGRPLKARKFYSNQIVSSKYTILTFLPRNLLEQFRRIANCFFLFINILQCISIFSTITPILVFLPLIVILLITALKDGYEDVKRHQADHHVNHSITHVLEGEGYENVNPMRAKSKTFIAGIPMPKRRSKKAKIAAAEELQEGGRATEPAREPGPSSQAAGDRRGASGWDDDPEAGDAPGELGWHRRTWEDIKVGDFVKIYDNEQFPADIVICATSEEEDVAYIETKNLDGETNLKSRHGVTGLNHLTTVKACRDAHLRVDLESPEVSMFRLNGAIINLDESSRNGDEPEIHPISLETTLLRGCVLKNTSWVIGMVIFTGYDTKIIQNSGATPSKRSKVERQMDPLVLVNLALLAIVAMVCAIVNYYENLRDVSNGAYWALYQNQPGDNPSVNAVITFFFAFITFQNIVPISLYISIEVVRSAQALFIYWDHAIKYVHNGVKTRTTARSWNLADDLGQIEYIFSDKTGTLTQNAMIFRQCSIGGKVYTGDEQPADSPFANANGIKEKGTNSSASDSSSSDSPAAPANGDTDIKVALPKEVLARFHDTALDRDLENHDSEQSRILHGFFAVLGLCHTVLAAEPEPGVIEYKAQSPDEAALVQTAADVGFVFRGRDKNIVRLSTPFGDEPDEYELLHILEFNSARKRMSVILRKLDDDGRLFLLCKGADNVIFERLAKDSAQSELRQKTDADLQYFASEGLRTLCLAYKVLDQGEYDRWARDYHEATVALHNREDQIEEVSNRIEQGLVLLGATAIEDKLQDGVPECISDLKRAGIKVWVATGDKLETAVAIGYTTHLLTPETNLIIVREGNHSVQDQLRDALEGFFAADHGEVQEDAMRRSLSRGSQAARLTRVNTGARSLVGEDNGSRPGGFSLVIEGQALAHAFQDPESSDLLLSLSTKCNTVICCRVSPLQKAQVVHLIKDNLGVMCLAIGDGANDVSMIQAADVGVGISGEEGLQAVNSSDYAIAQFRYLKRLLFVHGHWSYFRNSSMILNFFYKNIIGIGVLFWYQIYCGWSDTYVFAYIYLLFWNVFWTLLPVIAIGFFDRHIDADTLMALPELYVYSRRQTYFGLVRFSYYLLEGIFQSAVVFFIILYTYVTTTARGDGWNPYIYEISTTMVIGAVMVANFFSGLNIETWNAWVYFAILLGPVLIWVFTAVYTVIKPSSFYTGVYGNDIFLFQSAAYWFGWPFVLIIALLPRFLIRAIKQNYLPNDIDLMRLVRRFHPEADPWTHPLLGGKFSGVQKGKEDQEGNLEMDDLAMITATASGAENGNATRGHVRNRDSYHSARFGMHPSARGSQVDMSTGLRRDPSRGFDFTSEEGGVAMARMQSRLSEQSARRTKFGLPVLKSSKLRPTSERQGTPFGFSKIRERAGSVFSPKKRDRGNTTATAKSGRSEGTTGTGAANSPADGMLANAQVPAAEVPYVGATAATPGSPEMKSRVSSVRQTSDLFGSPSPGARERMARRDGQEDEENTDLSAAHIVPPVSPRA